MSEIIDPLAKVMFEMELADKMRAGGAYATASYHVARAQVWATLLSFVEIAASGAGGKHRAPGNAGFAGKCEVIWVTASMTQHELPDGRHACFKEPEHVGKHTCLCGAQMDDSTMSSEMK